MNNIFARTGKYVNQLSLPELFKEYIKVGEEAQEKTMTYIYVPEDSTNRKPLEREISELVDIKQDYANEIADRLTKN